MARVRRGFKARRRRSKILQLAKGFRLSRKNRFRTSIHVVRKALCYSYRDRKVRARDFRKLWIARINAASRQNGLRYSEFMHGLKLSSIDLDRSVLADMALRDSGSFAQLVDTVKKKLAA